MTAEILFDARFPHGSPQGFRDGCTGSACPSVMPCNRVYVRYQGDFAFRRRMDSGLSLAEITAMEDAERAVLVVKKPVKKVVKKRPPTPTLIDRTVLRRMLDEGLTDRQIADRLGLERRQVTGSRLNAGWERNPDKKGTRCQPIDARLPALAHLSVEEAAAVLDRAPSYVRRRRQIIAKTARTTT